MKTVKLLIIDKNMHTIEVEVDEHLFRKLEIVADQIKQNTSRNQLNKTVTQYLSSFQGQ